MNDKTKRPAFDLFFGMEVQVRMIPEAGADDVVLMTWM